MLLHLAAITVCGLLLLAVCNADVMWQAEELTLFMSGSAFANECLRHVGGGLEWVSRWAMQWWSYPWLGASMLVAVWALSYLLMRRLFRLPVAWQWLLLVPLFALMASTIDLGCWVYYLKQPGYWMRESLGLLCTLLLLWRLPERWEWLLGLLALALYPLIGWYAVLALALQALRAVLLHRWWVALLAVALALVGPGAIANAYPNLRLSEAWTAGFPLIEQSQNRSLTLTMPFVVVVLMLEVLQFSHLLPAYQVKAPNRTAAWRYYGLQLLAVGALAGSTALCNVSDYNYHAEIRAYRAAEEYDWHTVLDAVKQSPEGPTRQMVAFKNMALLYTGHLGDMMFRYENMGPEPVVIDSLRLHTGHTCAAMLYLRHGMANDAVRWATENCVEFGFTPKYLKVLAVASIVKGEYRVARKYLNMLARSAVHRDFAHRYSQLTMLPQTIIDYPELELMRELHDDQAEYLRGDEGFAEMHIYQMFANQLKHQSLKAEELAMAYAMMRKDYPLFWGHFANYVQRMPRQNLAPHYQEAALLGTQLMPERFPESAFHFSADIKSRYQNFVRQQPRKNDGSYWWYYYNCKNIRNY